jgi:hypothetical protein
MDARKSPKLENKNRVGIAFGASMSGKIPPKVPSSQQRKANLRVAKSDRSDKTSPMARVALTEVATVRWVLKFAI